MNTDGQVRADGDGVKMRDARRASSGNRNSGGSSGYSQRGSGGSAPEAWSKALDGFNFIVDKDVGSSPPYKQIQMQRNSKDGSSAVKRTVGVVPANGAKKASNIARPTQSPGAAGVRNSLQKTGSASNLKKMGSGSSLTKTSSGSSLTKTSSGSSLAKTGSGSSLVKTSSGTVLGKVGSNSNLRKVGSRELKKSESNASITSDSRPTTPNGRRASNSSVSGKKTEGAGIKVLSNGEKKTPAGVVGKKQVSSKIASLWKKEEGDSFPGGSKLPVSSAKGGKASSLPPSVGRGAPRFAGSKPLTGNTGRSEAGGAGGIKKSSTYDKLSTKSNAISVPLKSKDENDRVENGIDSNDERVCDITAHETENSFFDTSAAGDCVRADLSCFGNDTIRSEMNRTRESSVCSVDSLEGDGELDSGTYKKKKSDNSVNLPNADETCRSMPESLSSGNGNTSLKLKPGKWRKCKDDSGQRGDLDPDVWIKQDQKSKDGKSRWKGSKKESKSVAHSITQFFGKKFGSQRNSSKEWKKKKEDAAKVCVDVLKPPPPPSSSLKPTSCLRSERTSPSAIVPPFNYSPPVVQQPPANNRPDVKQENKKNDSDKSSLPATAHMTKTEMLLARRRRSYLNSSNQLDESSVSTAEEESKRGCLVTTV